MTDTLRELEDQASLYASLGEEVQRLPVKEKIVVALRSAGYTHNDCHLIIGLTRAAIGYIERRAFAKLKVALGDDE